MLVLALDIATRCGWALVEGEPPSAFALGLVPCRRVDSGHWNLDGGEDEAGARMLRLWKRCDEVRTELEQLDGRRIDLLAHEGLGHYKSDHTTLICVGLIAHAHSWAYRRGIPVAKSVGITEVAKLASGRGKATDRQRIDGAAALFKHTPKGHDEADALLVGAIAIDRALRL